MRLALVFLVIATLVIGFIIVDQFPGLIEGNPELRQINNKARELLGLELRDLSYVPDQKFKDPRAVLSQQAQEDEMRAACGDPPENPWAGGTPPTEADLDRYSLALEMWRYCVRNRERQKMLPLAGSQGSGVPSRSQLKSYEEQ